MVPTHPVASQIADRTIPPRDGRGLLPAPTARTAALSTSIRPRDRALSIAGLPLPSRLRVDSLIALAKLRLLSQRQRARQYDALKRAHCRRAVRSHPAPYDRQRPRQSSRATPRRGTLSAYAPRTLASARSARTSAINALNRNHAPRIGRAARRAAAWRDSPRRLASRAL